MVQYVFLSTTPFGNKGIPHLSQMFGIPDSHLGSLQVLCPYRIAEVQKASLCVGVYRHETHEEMATDRYSPGERSALLTHTCTHTVYWALLTSGCLSCRDLMFPLCPLGAICESIAYFTHVITNEVWLYKWLIVYRGLLSHDPCHITVKGSALEVTGHITVKGGLLWKSLATSQ